MTQKLAVLRIRGNVGVRKDIKDTLDLLRLYKKNSCIIINNSPSCIGMLKKVKDYVTWGEIDEETFLQLIKKRGRLPGSKPLTEDYLKEKTKLSYEQFAKEFMNDKKDLKDITGVKRVFRLKPPEKGFERKGIKTPFSLGGVLGYRKDRINDLIRRML